MGPIPQTLGPIFRDRDDFSGGHTLAEATIAALDDSAALIVLCSTIAAGRPAVNEEVRLFRSRHPDRLVIPVILEGSPPDNFPPALRYELASDGTVTDRPVTILGPDLREHADGSTLGLAKLVAGLLGVRTDEIVRRAERHRRRRLRNWVAGLSAVATVLAGLVVWAEFNRRIAVEQRLTATSRQLSAQSLTKLGDQFELALLLAVAANRIKPTQESKSILLSGLQRHQYLETFLHGHTAEVHQVAFSPDGHLLASVSGTHREDFTV